MTKKKSTTKNKQKKTTANRTTRQLELVLRAMTLVKETADRAVAQSNRLQAFFGPMLDGKNPPLDGAQVASKAYVDDGLARLAGTLRSEAVRS